MFSSGGESLEQIVGYFLQMRGATLSVAESCTGGLLAERITRISGSSRYFMGGALVYSDAAEDASSAACLRLLLASDGAVSRSVAAALAEGIRQRCKTTLGIGITGIAGPTGGTEEKPVGLVYVALADGKQTEVRGAQISRRPRAHSLVCHATGARHAAAQAALNLCACLLPSTSTKPSSSGWTIMCALCMPRLPGVRFVRSNTYHVTLQFLGEVQQAEAVRERLREVRARGLSRSRLAGWDSSPTRARRESSGPGSMPPALPGAGPQHRCSRLRRWALPPERDFHPHLTLARNGSGQAASGARRAAAPGICTAGANCGFESGPGVRYNDGARVLFIRKQAVAQRAELPQARRFAARRLDTLPQHR